MKPDRKAYYAAWYAANREKVLARMRVYYHDPETQRVRRIKYAAKRRAMEAANA